MSIAPFLRVGVAVVATLILWLPPSMKSATAHDKARPFPALLASPHTLDFRTKADAALTDWALSRFQQAGLELPPLAVAFHDSKQPCEGYVGLYRSGDTPRVDICGFNWDRFLITPKKTLLHELAHAWAGANLSEEAKERFVRFRHLPTWGDDRFPWGEQGSEQAAEIIAWALLDEELVMAHIQNTDPQRLARAYELLTSTESPSWARFPLTTIGTGMPDDQGLVD
jgi:hypothetical protein